MIIRSNHVNKPTSLFSNTLFSSISGGTTFVYGTILFIILGRLLDIDEFGTFSLALTVAGILALLPSYGFDLFVIRELSQGTICLGKLVINVVVVKLVFALTSFLVLQIYINWMSIHDQAVTFWLLGFSATFLSFSTFFSSLLKAYDNFQYEATAKILQSSFHLASIILITWIFDLSVLLVAWLLFFSRLIELIYSVHAYWKIGNPESFLHFDLSIAWVLTGQSLPFAIQTILGNLFFQIDTVFIGAILDSTNVGYYQVSMRFLLGVMMIPTTLMNAFYPTIARSFSSTNLKSADLSISRLLIHLLLLIGSFLTIVFLFGASPLILLLYGKKMVPAIPILRVLSLIIIVRFVASGYGLILVSARYQKIQLYGATIALTVNICLNLFFLPRLGIISSAWASWATNFIILCIYIFYIRRILGTYLLNDFLCSVSQIVQYINLQFGKHVNGR
jgi:O-antigen/teichoic acid export membrane protein